jgi:3'-phosphoadenosine 5'-phosphosulfate sulfotransferase (PAPS reductase)/FAD synthetase
VTETAEATMSLDFATDFTADFTTDFTRGVTTAPMRLPAVNALAHWTFEDCFDYATKYKLPLHPCLERGNPWHGLGFRV